MQTLLQMKYRPYWRLNCRYIEDYFLKRVCHLEPLFEAATPWRHDRSLAARRSMRPGMRGKALPRGQFNAKPIGTPKSSTQRTT